MTDEPENPVLMLLHQIGAKIDHVDTKVDRLTIRADRTDANLERMDARLDRMDAKLDRAAARTDDVMAAQVKMATDIAAIRTTQEEALEAQTAPRT